MRQMMTMTMMTKKRMNKAQDTSDFISARALPHLNISTSPVHNLVPDAHVHPEVPSMASLCLAFFKFQARMLRFEAIKKWDPHNRKFIRVSDMDSTKCLQLYHCTHS